MIPVNQRNINSCAAVLRRWSNHYFMIANINTAQWQHLYCVIGDWHRGSTKLSSLLDCHAVPDQAHSMLSFSHFPHPHLKSMPAFKDLCMLETVSKELCFQVRKMSGWCGQKVYSNSTLSGLLVVCWAINLFLPGSQQGQQEPFGIIVRTNRFLNLQTVTWALIFLPTIKGLGPHCKVSHHTLGNKHQNPIQS